MSTAAWRSAFEAEAQEPKRDWLQALAGQAARLKTGDGGSDAARAIALGFVRAAFARPALIMPVYDAVSAGWAGDADHRAPAVADDVGPLVLPAEQWRRFWAAVDLGASDGAKGITLAVTNTLGASDLALEARAAEAAFAFAGVRQAAGCSLRAPYDIATLKNCAAGSLGERFYRLIVDNGFDVEVLNREELALTSLPPVLRYTNTRILQTHDLWHLVAGYDTTILHEIGISAFQLAQFGHLYSAAFLATVATLTSQAEAVAAQIYFATVAAAWAHGRATPPLMAIEWEHLWDRPIDAIRADYGIAPFASPYPANLIEQVTGTKG